MRQVPTQPTEAWAVVDAETGAILVSTLARTRAEAIAKGVDRLGFREIGWRKMKVRLKLSARRVSVVGAY